MQLKKRYVFDILEREVGQNLAFVLLNIVILKREKKPPSKQSNNCHT